MAAELSRWNATPIVMGALEAGFSGDGDSVGKSTEISEDLSGNSGERAAAY
jgi:hypothetical protein